MGWFLFLQSSLVFVDRCVALWSIFRHPGDLEICCAGLLDMARSKCPPLLSLIQCRGASPTIVCHVTAEAASWLLDLAYARLSISELGQRLSSPASMSAQLASQRRTTILVEVLMSISGVWSDFVAKPRKEARRPQWISVTATTQAKEGCSRKEQVVCLRERSQPVTLSSSVHHVGSRGSQAVPAIAMQPSRPGSHQTNLLVSATTSHYSGSLQG